MRGLRGEEMQRHLAVEALVSIMKRNQSVSYGFGHMVLSACHLSV